MEAPRETNPSGTQIVRISLRNDSEDEIKLKILQAGSESGFFFLIDHGAEEAIAELFRLQRLYFALDQSEKNCNISKSKLASTHVFGYLGVERQRDKKEVYSVGSALYDNDEFWPVSLGPEFRIQVRTIYDLLHKLSLAVMELIASALRWETDYFAPFHKNDSVLRFHRYPTQENESVVVAPHADWGTLTLLLIEGIVGGLQIFRSDEQIWSDVVPVENAICCNMGDILSTWSQGQFKSIFHRVVMQCQQPDRYSAAFFLRPDQDCEIQCQTVKSHFMQMLQRSRQVNQT
eukprot:TRINITY_DN13323_c0_g1_i2.p1 TRINITY_DN13323_c0_g1~~TRINITY_DN13323_c0_g1_i2.p1  ORF type:complete len:290 (-),score=5.88 TRINITY_DN13323_c0_g1_i2:66-935(-)